MNDRPAWIRETAEGVRIEVLVQPRASRTRAVGEHDGRLKIQVAAPPVDGAANEALVAHLSERLRLPRSNITIVAGETGRRKSVEIAGADPDAVLQALTS